MATRQTWAHDYAKRLKALGWRTEQLASAGGAYKVWMPPCDNPLCNHQLQMHLSSSDTNAYKRVLRELNEHGFEQQEQFKATEEKLATQARLAKQRRAAEEKATVMATKAATRKATPAALKRAAGPYLIEPEEKGIDWFTQKHPAPTMEWVWMTPEIAAHLLEFHNVPGAPGVPGTNRPKSERQIAHYRDIILSGQWKLTHQGMAMDTEANVQDAQHRLSAIVAAGEVLDTFGEELPDEVREKLEANDNLDPDGNLRVPVAFFVGMPPSNFKAIDEGLLRNATQLFTMGGEKNGATLRSALRIVCVLEDGDVDEARNRVRLRMTNAQLLEAMERAGDLIRKSASFGASHAAKAKMTVSAFAAGHYLLFRHNGEDNRFVQAFIEGLVNGYRLTVDGKREMLDDDDPRVALRNTLTLFKERNGRALTALDQVGLMIMAWNNVVTERHVRRLNWPKGAPIPRMLQLLDDGVSKAPRALEDEVEQ